MLTIDGGICKIKQLCSILFYILYQCLFCIWLCSVINMTYSILLKDCNICLTFLIYMWSLCFNMGKSASHTDSAGLFSVCWFRRLSAGVEWRDRASCCSCSVNHRHSLQTRLLRSLRQRRWQRYWRHFWNTRWWRAECGLQQWWHWQWRCCTWFRQLHEDDVRW